MFVNPNWRTYRAIEELEIYCELLEGLQDRIDSLETHGQSEEVTLLNVQAVLSSYAIEIAMKSLWAIDNPANCVPHKHDLTILFDGLDSETVKSLGQLQLTRESLENSPVPFVTNRYSMEIANRDIVIFQSGILRTLIGLLSDKLEGSRTALFKARGISSP